MSALVGVLTLYDSAVQVLPQVVLYNLACLCVDGWLQVTYLTIADFSMREELVLKIAILAEKFAPSVEVGQGAGSCMLNAFRLQPRQRCGSLRLVGINM